MGDDHTRYGKILSASFGSWKRVEWISVSPSATVEKQNSWLRQPSPNPIFFLSLEKKKTSRRGKRSSTQEIVE
jgi:hypothetical protein